MIDYRSTSDAHHASNGAQWIGNVTVLGSIAGRYPFAPSAVIIRSAEAELLRRLPMVPPILDLCCGDGFFASLVVPRCEAGCDISRTALSGARATDTYGVVACADVSAGIPFRDASFATVFSNSSLEHVADIEPALREVRRVLRPGGRFYTTFASDFAYQWWPWGDDQMRRYWEFQPVYNRFSFEEWREQMARAGLTVVRHQYYLSKPVTQFFTFLDYHFSHVYLTSDPTPARRLIGLMRRLPPTCWSRVWQRVFSPFQIVQNGSGGGILIEAERREDALT